MGALYLARDPQLDRLVAIKLLKDDLQDNSELRERFLREARSVARLRHSNIVVVHDVGEDEGRSFMAMEYIAGATLADVLLRTPVPPLTARLAMVEDLCAGLAHAHSAGIIHRDIKPANIMIDADGVVKILDFGIARLADSGMTQEGQIMGSVNYMSPEQVMGRGVDQRTDIFAAGTVLYELITLKQAFPGGIDTGVLHRILHEGPLPLERWTPDIDPELATVVQRAMARDPSARYQEASVMRGDLMRVRRRLANDPDGANAATLVLPTATTAPTVAPEARRPDGDQQATEQVRLGEEALALGEFETALAHADRAVSLSPGGRTASMFRDKVRTAIEARATAVRVREERIADALDRARASMEKGGFETALRAVYEILALDPDRAEARELEQRAQAQIQARRQGTDDRPSTVSHQAAPIPAETTRPPSSPLRLFAIAGAIAALASVAVIGALWMRTPEQPAAPQSAAPASPAQTPAPVPVPVAPPVIESSPAPVVEPPPAIVQTPAPAPSAAPGPAPAPSSSPRRTGDVPRSTPAAAPAPPAVSAPPPSIQVTTPAPAPSTATPAVQSAPAASTTAPAPRVVDPPLPPVLAAQRAMQLLAEGAERERVENWSAALEFYERARKMDPNLALATAGVNRVLAEMLADGTEAFRQAQQFESAKRINDAISWYERAVRNLPDSSPEKRTAIERLRVLKSGR
jgi:tetratricopeptide (TPR) repeat protein